MGDVMVIKNIPKSEAEKYRLLLSELRPEWRTEIIAEDYNLYKLGLIDEIPCFLNIEASYEQLIELHMDIMDMEIAVYHNEDLKCKSPVNMTPEEKREYNLWKEAESEYKSYASIASIVDYWLPRQSK